MDINLLLKKPNDNITFNQALADIATIADNLDAQAITALQYMINKAQKKEAGQLKLDNPFKVASLFMAKKDIRFYLNFIYSDGAHLIASNGHIAIVVNHACQSGFYNSTGTLIENEDFAKLPNFDKYLQLVNEIEINPDALKNGELKIDGKYQVRCIDNNVWFNDDYLAIFRRLKPENIYLINHYHLLAKADNYTAIIMPISV
jgi:hypothetical protein